MRKIRTALLCGLGLSLVIKTLQYLFGTGVSELDDLTLNTLRVWIGAVTVQRYRNDVDKRISLYSFFIGIG